MQKLMELFLLEILPKVFILLNQPDLPGNSIDSDVLEKLFQSGKIFQVNL